MNKALIKNGLFTEILKNKITKKKKANMRKARTRVAVDFPIADHRRLKAVSALMDLSMQDYIIGCAEEKLYTTNIPNVKTRKAMEDVEKRKRGKVCKRCR